MKKIILYSILILSLINSISILAMNNNNNIKKCEELPNEIWYEISSKLVNIEKIKSAKALEELKSAVALLYNFALISKIHNSVLQFIKEKYLSKERELIEEIIEKIKEDIPEFDLKNNIDAKNNFGNTALICAAKNGYKEIVELLIKYNANIDTKNEYGSTALISAAVHGYNDIAKLLVENNADVNMKDKQRRTALIWASIFGYKEIVKLIKEKMNKNNNNNKSNF